MKHIQKGITLVLFILLFDKISYSQGGAANPDNFAKMVDFLPPAPNAAAITKYGNIALNKNNGSPNISIPLFSMRGKNMAVDIALGYSSTGIKVDEIASRTGMGWVLKAGGVITRTVRGWADETHTRKVPWGPIGTNWQTFQFMKDVSDATFYNGGDAEPDLFSFNCPGVSGSFIFDSDMNPVQLPYSNVKIIPNFSGTDWNFKIITPNGTEYLFGGTGRVEKTKRITNCAKSFDDYITTAWYLKKITHPNGDVFTFDYESLNYQYETGLSQSMTYAHYGKETNGLDCTGSGTCSNGSFATISPTCINKTLTQGVLLKWINGANNQKLKLQYMDREDCTDKLINGIELYNTIDNTLVSSYSLAYSTITSNGNYQGETEYGINKTPYLISLTEYPSDNSGSKLHSFQYNDASARPKRLSFSQDHWGYFNGKNNSNMMPKPTNLQLETYSRFNNANAEREANDVYASKGMLNKIIYPTGGMDSIMYESNTYWSPSGTVPLPHQFTCDVTGPAFNQETQKTHSFYINATQDIELYITVTTPDPNGFFDPIHDLGRVIISQSSGSPEFDEVFSPGTTAAQRFVHLTAGGYTLTFKARGLGIKTTVSLKYTGSASLSNQNITIGGLRVKSVLTGTPGQLPMVKKYYYGELNSLNTSSAMQVQAPDYTKFYKIKSTCIITTVTPTQLGINYCSFTSLHSNSLISLFDYQSSPVSYGSVVESNGENFEGGGIQSKFYTAYDQKGIVLWGDEIKGATKSSFSNFGNGNPKEEIVLKKATNGNLIPVKKTQYTYKFDSRGFKSAWGYVINKKYEYGPYQPFDSTCSIDPAVNSNWAHCYGNLQDNIECFDMMKYEYPVYWLYNDTTREIAYDENGQNPLTTQTINYYDNDQYLQLTRIETTNSRGELLTTLLKYPFDYSGSPGNVYTDMVAKGIVTPVVNTKTLNTNVALTEVKTNYQKQSNNDFVIGSIEKKDKGGAFETEGIISIYDAADNICEFTGKDGVANAIIWGYGSMYPVAKVTGATYAQAVAQLTNGVAGLSGLDGQALRDELNNIRTNLPDALVTTYTYKHLTGVLSITDPNNKTNTFEYDGFNRLKLVKDQDGNVVKKMEYAYNVSNATAQFGIYANEEQNLSFNCQNCSSGYMGSSVTYSIPAGRFYSLISVADANSKAIVDANINGQAYANKNGYCSNSINCSGEGYKIINCLCQLGTKVCESATQNGNGTWTNHYHYHWSDNTNSQSYTNTTPACIGAAFKRIGCDCVEGMRINTDTYFQKNPTPAHWVCVYHYVWPDGSVSQDYTENNATPCQLFANGGE